jgi:hypothetical protein
MEFLRPDNIELNLNGFQSVDFEENYLGTFFYEYTKIYGVYLSLPIFTMKDVLSISKSLHQEFNKPLITYRKVGDWYSKKLLEDNRKDEKQKHKLSAKDFIKLLIINDLKDYGLENNKVKEIINNAFERNHKVLSKKHIKFNADKISYFEFFTYATMGSNIKTYLAIDIKGKTCYFLESKLAILLGNNICQNNSLLVIPYYVYVMPIADYFIKKRIKFKDNETIDSMLEKLPDVKEMFIINCVRNQDYEEIGVKRNDETLIIKLKQKRKPMSDKELIAIIKESDFQNIDLTMANGNIVSLNQEKTIKW